MSRAAEALERRAQRAVRGDGELARPAPRALCARLRAAHAGAVVTMMTGPAVGCREQAGAGRRPQPPVENDARQRALAVGAAGRQQRIVGEHRAHADADGVDFGPEPLGVPVRARRTSARRTPGRRGDAAVAG